MVGVNFSPTFQQSREASALNRELVATTRRIIAVSYRSLNPFFGLSGGSDGAEKAVSERKGMASPEMDAKLAAVQDKLFLLKIFRHFLERPETVVPAAFKGTRSRAVTEAKKQIEEMERDVARFNSIYDAEPWSRYYRVAEGHVHSSQACTTCYPNTIYHMISELSGKSVREAVEVFGRLMCNVCFPEALKIAEEIGPSRIEKTKQARKQAREARQLAAAEKEIAPLKVPSTVTEIRTWKDAKRELAKAIEIVETPVPTKETIDACVKSVDVLARALAEKLGGSPEDFIAEARKEAGIAR